MDRRLHVATTLQGVRVFLVQLEQHESVAVMLRALGADVRVFASLREAEAGAIPTGTTVLVVRLCVAACEDDAGPITLVVKGFGVLGVLRREAPPQPSFADRFAEAHQGQPEAAILCASVLRAAGLSRERLLGQRDHHGTRARLRIAI